jgi:hypothetical protein
MPNSADILNQPIRNGKSLRRFAEQFSKARKHRYERRKVRSFIRLGDWNEDDSN